MNLSKFSMIGLVVLCGCSERFVFKVCNAEGCQFFDQCDVGGRGGSLCWNLGEDMDHVFAADHTVEIINVAETVPPRAGYDFSHDDE